MKYHTQQDGKRLLISDMTDEHLKNTIDLFFKKIAANQNIIKSDIKENGNLDLVGSWINIGKLKKTATANIENLMENISAYIYEATIRGISYTEKLQEIHGRKTATSFFNNEDLKLLSSGDDYDDLPF